MVDYCGRELAVAELHSRQIFFGRKKRFLCWNLCSFGFLISKLKNMIISSTDYIPGRKIAEVIDIARGSTVRARNLGRDMIAGLKNIVGGEIVEYAKLMADAREHAIDRMIADAERIGADAIINVRFTTASVMAGCSEILAYGTAVKLSRQ